MRSRRNSISAHLKLPANLPVSLPSKLVDQRPDVRAAEANMHSASAQVGVAIAARLPNITLSANGGSARLQLAQSFAPGTGFYTLAAGVTAPIFDGFTLYNKQKAAEAGARPGRRAISRHRDHRVPERRRCAARAAGGCTRDEARRVRAETAAKASLDIVQTAVERGPGQPARRAQRAANLSDRGGVAGADRSQPPLRHRRLVHGAGRRLAYRLHHAGVAGMRDGRSAAGGRGGEPALIATNAYPGSIPDDNRGIWHAL